MNHVILEAGPSLHPFPTLSGTFFLNGHPFRITCLLLHNRIPWSCVSILNCPIACRLPPLYIMKTPIPSYGALWLSLGVCGYSPSEFLSHYRRPASPDRSKDIFRDCSAITRVFIELPGAQLDGAHAHVFLRKDVPRKMFSISFPS